MLHNTRSLTREGTTRAHLSRSSRRAAQVVQCSAPDLAAGTAQRRAVLLGGACVAVSTSTQAALLSAICHAEEGPSASSVPLSGSAPRVFMEVKLEGQPIGTITVELLPEVAPVGSARFSDLTIGKLGVGYRLSRFDGIFDTYVRNEGVKSLSYGAAEGADAASPISGGDSTLDLERELSAPGALHHSEAGLVSLVVREEKERPVKEKLVAMNGQLVTIQQQAGEAPNGTAFCITTAPTPSLDATNLVVGRVVAGWEVVQAVAALPFSRPRDSWYDKPFFETGKAIGDKRAVVAEKFVRRPLKRVIVGKTGTA